MALLIDSSIFIALERRGEAPVSLLDRFGDQPAAISAVTASELLHGVHRAEGAVRRGRRESFVEAVFQALPVLPFTLDVARVHSRLWVDLLARGAMIGERDLIIAATALAHDLTLVSSDRRHFGSIADLSVALW